MRIRAVTIDIRRCRNGRRERGVLPSLRAAQQRLDRADRAVVGFRDRLRVQAASEASRHPLGRGKAGVATMRDMDMTERKPELEGQRPQRQPAPAPPARTEPTHLNPNPGLPSRNCNNITFASVKRKASYQRLGIAAEIGVADLNGLTAGKQLQRISKLARLWYPAPHRLALEQLECRGQALPRFRLR